MLEQIAEQAGYVIVAIGVFLIIATCWMISKTGTKRKGKKVKEIQIRIPPEGYAEVVITMLLDRETMGQIREAIINAENG